MEDIVIMKTSYYKTTKFGHTGYQRGEVDQLPGKSRQSAIRGDKSS